MTEAFQTPTEPTEKKTKRSRWPTFLGLVLILLAVGWYFDGILLARLKLIADDIPAKMDDAVGLHFDNQVFLQSVEPRRLVVFARSPSEQMRAAVLMGLSTRSNESAIDNTEASWAGVLQRLASSGVAEPNKWLKKATFRAIMSVKMVPKSDLPGVLSALRQLGSSPLDKDAVDVDVVVGAARQLHKLHPDQQSALKTIAVDWTKANQWSAKRRGIIVLNELVPSDSDVKDIALALFKAGHDEARDTAKDAWRIAAMQPELFTELVGGDLNTKYAAVLTFAEIRENKVRSRSGPATIPEPLKAAFENKKLQLELANIAKELILDPKQADGFTELANYIAQTPDARNLLFEASAVKDPKRLTAVLTSLATVATPRPRGPKVEWPEFAIIAVLDALMSPDEALRNAATPLASSLFVGGRGEPAVELEKPALKAKAIAGFRNILDNPGIYNDNTPIRFFCEIAPFGKDDVVRMVAAVRRNNRKFPPFSGGRQWSPLVQRAFDLLCNKFPNDPEVKKLKTEAPPS